MSLAPRLLALIIFDQAIEASISQTNLPDHPETARIPKIPKPLPIITRSGNLIDSFMEKFTGERFSNLIPFEEKLHPKINPTKIDRLFTAATLIFPGQKVNFLDAAGVFYTEFAFASLKPGADGDLGTFQVIPLVKDETLTQLRNFMADPETRSATAYFFELLGLPNDPSSIATLEAGYGQDVDLTSAIGVLNLQRVANFTDDQIKLNKLDGLSESTRSALLAAGNNRFAAPMVLLSDFKGIPAKDISASDLDLHLKYWSKAGGRSFPTPIIDHYDKKGNPVYKQGFFDVQSIENLRLYIRRSEYFRSVFAFVSAGISEGRISQLPSTFPETMRRQIDTWIAEDLAKNGYCDTSSPDRAAQLFNLVYPKITTAKK